jgi:hypothetical protein
LLHQILSDSDLFLNYLFGKGRIAAAQQHFDRLVLQCIGDLPAPAVAGLKRENVGEGPVSVRFKARPKPENEVVVLRRSLADENDAATSIGVSDMAGLAMVATHLGRSIQIRDVESRAMVGVSKAKKA